MVIIVSGAIGVGKTSVCRKLVELVRKQGFICGGILTNKAANNSLIIEDVRSGKTETLASTDNVYDGPRTPKYSFNPKGIDFGLKAINEGASADILVVDELGHLELRGEGFSKVFDIIRAGKVKDCVLVIRTELLPAFLPHLPKNPVIFETTLENRNQLPEKIANRIIKHKQET